MKQKQLSQTLYYSLLGSVAVLLIACASMAYMLTNQASADGDAVSSNPETTTEGASETSTSEKTSIPASTPIDTSALTELAVYPVDFNGDGEEDSIKVYTAAKVSESGEVMWDDGQDWLIIAQSKTGTYTLFNEFVQLGEIMPFIYTSADGKFHMTTLQPGSASMIFADYIYDSESQSFNKSIIYNPEGVNLLN